MTDWASNRQEWLDSPVSHSLYSRYTERGTPRLAAVTRLEAPPMFCQPTAVTTRNGLDVTHCAKCGHEYLAFRKRVCPKAR